MPSKLKARLRIFTKYLIHGIADNTHLKNRIVMVSYPRSGSSWIGKVLSHSPRTTYLREPITQPYLRVYGGEHALVDPKKDLHAALFQKILYDLALNAKVFDLAGKISSGISTDQNSATQTLLVKEVNPYAAHLIKARSNLRTVFLLRHPAAVALSFSELGWLKSPDTQTPIPGKTNDNEWSMFGYAYGTATQRAISTLSRHKHSHIVFYERLARNPYEEFLTLFDTLKLDTPDNFDSLIAQYCYRDAPLHSGYHTRRNSAATAEKWRSKLGAKAISELREGYFSTKCEWYRDESDWDIDAQA